MFSFFFFFVFCWFVTWARNAFIPRFIVYLKQKKKKKQYVRERSGLDCRRKQINKTIYRQPGLLNKPVDPQPTQSTKKKKKTLDLRFTNKHHKVNRIERLYNQLGVLQ